MHHPSPRSIAANIEHRCATKDFSLRRPASTMQMGLSGRRVSTRCFEHGVYNDRGVPCYFSILVQTATHRSARGRGAFACSYDFLPPEECHTSTAFLKGACYATSSGTDGCRHSMPPPLVTDRTLDADRDQQKSTGDNNAASRSSYERCGASTLEGLLDS